MDGGLEGILGEGEESCGYVNMRVVCVFGGPCCKREQDGEKRVDTTRCGALTVAFDLTSTGTYTPAQVHTNPHRWSEN